MQQWIEIIDRALAEGYAGLRVAVDMSWALDGFPGAERLLDYEHRLTSFVFDGHPLIGLCEYDRNLFGDMATKQLIQAHEHGLVQPAGGLDGSQVRVLKSFEPPGVRVFGAITEGKRAAFESALRHVAHATSGDVMLDMSNVPEIDKAGVQAIVRVARELYVGRALVVRGVQPALAEVFAQFSHLKSLRMEMPAPDSAANIFRNLPET